MPIPAVMPLANASSATLMLLVMIALEAIGLMATIECVHISWRSIVSIISGPRIEDLKSGSTDVSAAPSAAEPAKSASEIRHGTRLARNTDA